jgi:hypothetical protein
LDDAAERRITVECRRGPSQPLNALNREGRNTAPVDDTGFDVADRNAVDQHGHMFSLSAAEESACDRGGCDPRCMRGHDL